jgi:hypothetical protein
MITETTRTKIHCNKNKITIKMVKIKTINRKIQNNYGPGNS